ncbi:tetratricopeptide repeat protein [Mastigocladopsis repens]|uniref:tetratricopeptide repeat protein n=1 Tax=Mastigocladopsis repens TaxID=221287 RepID=UPI0002DA34F2|nr:tetratricopeptide repeat protein [Mastigocladopsis repens]
MQRYGEAIASDDKAIEIKPDNHEAWYKRGIALHLRAHSIPSRKRSVVVGNQSRSAVDHAFNLQVNLTPYGIFVPDSIQSDQ